MSLVDDLEYPFILDTPVVLDDEVEEAGCNLIGRLIELKSNDFVFLECFRLYRSSVVDATVCPLVEASLASITFSLSSRGL